MFKRAGTKPTDVKRTRSARHRNPAASIISLGSLAVHLFLPAWLLTLEIEIMQNKP